MQQWTMVLAQTAEAAGTQAQAPWWHVVLNNAVGLTVLFIFLAAVIGLVMRMRQRDKCLKLMRDTHVTFLATNGRVIWGDLRVYSQGLELVFEAPYRSGAGITKTSEMIYEQEMGSCLAIARLEEALTDQEKRFRRRQVRRSFNPGVIRRTKRSLVNFVNILRDAFSKALSALVGHLMAKRPGMGAGGLADQRGNIDQIGQTLLGGVARAYEPMLEHHIGKPVVLRMISPTDEKKVPIELPGYLVDYSDKYVAVFNVEQEAMEEIRLTVTANLENLTFKVALDGGRVMITNVGTQVLVVRSVTVGDQQHDLEVALLRGSRLALPRPGEDPVQLHLVRTRRIDVVCPRTVGVVLFGGDKTAQGRRGWRGLAPQETDQPISEESTPVQTEQR